MATNGYGMIQSANIDPPPPGPIRWRWVTKAFASLLRAARIISPDESVNIDATTGGFSLSQNAPPTTDTRIDIKNIDGDIYEVPALSLFVVTGGFFELAAQSVTIRQDQILCLRYAYTYGLFQSLADESVTLVSITASQLESATIAKPTDETPVAGLIYIPIAIRQNGFVVFPKQTNIGLDNYVTLKFSMG